MIVSPWKPNAPWLPEPEVYALMALEASLFRCLSN
jgi:hypothetical protein